MFPLFLCLLWMGGADFLPLFCCRCSLKLLPLWWPQNLSFHFLSRFMVSSKTLITVLVVVLLIIGAACSPWSQNSIDGKAIVDELDLDARNSSSHGHEREDPLNAQGPSRRCATGTSCRGHYHRYMGYNWILSCMEGNSFITVNKNGKIIFFSRIFIIILPIKWWCMDSSYPFTCILLALGEGRMDANVSHLSFCICCKNLSIASFAW